MRNDPLGKIPHMARFSYDDVPVFPTHYDYKSSSAIIPKKREIDVDVEFPNNPEIPTGGPGTSQSTEAEENREESSSSDDGKQQNAPVPLAVTEMSANPVRQGAATIEPTIAPIIPDIPPSSPPNELSLNADLNPVNLDSSKDKQNESVVIHEKNGDEIVIDAQLGGIELKSGQITPPRTESTSSRMSPILMAAKVVVEPEASPALFRAPAPAIQGSVAKIGGDTIPTVHRGTDQYLIQLHGLQPGNKITIEVRVDDQPIYGKGAFHFIYQ